MHWYRSALRFRTVTGYPAGPSLEMVMNLSLLSFQRGMVIIVLLMARACSLQSLSHCCLATCSCSAMERMAPASPVGVAL
jgi:hypothetical protein